MQVDLQQKRIKRSINVRKNIKKMYGITNYNGELTEFSTIDELVGWVLEQGIDPSKPLYLNGEETGETVFEYMVARDD